MAQRSAQVGTSFLDLPPEIRNEIYRYCLVIQRPFGFTSDKMPPLQKKGPMRVSNRPGAERDTIPFAPGILQVNKEVHNEAISIFYGENIFQFQYAWVGEKILAQIGQQNVGQLRHIEVISAEGKKSAISLVFTKLKKAKNLKTITLEHRRGRALGEYWDWEIAQALAPLMRHLLKRTRSRELASGRRRHRRVETTAAGIEEVLAMVKWKHDPFVKWGGKDAEGRKQEAMEFGNRVAPMLKKMLK